MKTLMSFIQSTLIGGAIFVLPIGIVFMSLTEVFEIAQGAGSTLQEQFFRDVVPDLALTVAALLLILFAAFSVGLFARTQVGVGLSGRIEKSVVGRFPLYSITRQMLADIAGGVGRLDSNAVQVVLVHLDDRSVFGFLLEKAGSEKAVVFLPGAPSALSGSVAIVTLRRVEPVDLTVTELLNSMRALGTGLVRAPH